MCLYFYSPFLGGKTCPEVSTPNSGLEAPGHFPKNMVSGAPFRSTESGTWTVEPRNLRLNGSSGDCEEQPGLGHTARGLSLEFWTIPVGMQRSG